jgi:hypothetical protein
VISLAWTRKTAPGKVASVELYTSVSRGLANSGTSKNNTQILQLFMKNIKKRKKTKKTGN